jgi:hypothetical protein
MCIAKQTFEGLELYEFCGSSIDVAAQARVGEC